MKTLDIVVLTRPSYEYIDRIQEWLDVLLRLPGPEGILLLLGHPLGDHVCQQVRGHLQFNIIILLLLGHPLGDHIRRGQGTCILLFFFSLKIISNQP